jgi:hypothetical protein
MYDEKIEKLKSLGDITISVREIVEVKEKMAAGAPVCVAALTWIIQQTVAFGITCTGGDLVLGGFFTAAEGLFPEADETLIPLEAIVIDGWTTVCDDVGVAAIGANAEQWASFWCSKL